MFNKIIFISSIILNSSISFSQKDCFQIETQIDSIAETKYLEFITLEENDSVIKVFWWSKGDFDYKKSADTLTFFIIEENPNEYKTDSITFRGHALEGNFYSNDKRVLFYTICK